MYGGQLVERGNVRDVLLDPRHPYTLGLVRSAPDFEYVQDSLRPIPGSPPSLITPPPGCRFHPRCEFAEDDCRTEVFRCGSCLAAGPPPACTMSAAWKPWRPIGRHGERREPARRGHGRGRPRPGAGRRPSRRGDGRCRPAAHRGRPGRVLPVGGQLMGADAAHRAAAARGGRGRPGGAPRRGARPGWGSPLREVHPGPGPGRAAAARPGRDPVRLPGCCRPGGRATTGGVSRWSSRTRTPRSTPG